MGRTWILGHSKTLLRAVKHGYRVLPGRGEPSSAIKAPIRFRAGCGSPDCLPWPAFGFRCDFATVEEQAATLRSDCHP